MHLSDGGAMFTTIRIYGLTGKLMSKVKRGQLRLVKCLSDTYIALVLKNVPVGDVKNKLWRVAEICIDSPLGLDRTKIERNTYFNDYLAESPELHELTACKQ